MIRGLGYLKSLDDLANVPVMAKNGNARTHQGSGNSFLRPRYAGRFPASGEGTDEDHLARWCSS
jgi:hypothetical protein